ncbi:MAG TPA: AAA family ATPase [Pantanalinema sp.]
MFPSIPGYRLAQEIHRSNRSLLYRGSRDADGARVIVKVLNHDHPAPQDLARLRQEYQLLSTLDGPEVVPALDLVEWRNNLALVLADVGLEPIDAQLEAGERMPLDRFFAFAVPCARALARLHRRVTHRDLTPRHILWSPRHQQVRFVDFCLASRVGAEREAHGPTQHLLGSLPFLSPEQSGRMDRRPDERSDLYSLGVVFYRLLSGQLPFHATDPMEWVYCHLTKVPVPLDQLVANLPGPLCDLVSKLLAKNPDDRYQSALGLVRDLEECSSQWGSTGTVAPFRLACSEVAAHLLLTERLYARQQELDALRASLHAASSSPHLALISGQAGSGKSALVDAFAEETREQGSFFMAGKFEQYRHNVPYAAVSQALTSLVRRLLSEPEDYLAQWKARINETLGGNGRLALELVPEIEHLIGKQPPLSELNPTEEQNRFLATINHLFALFARPEHPVVLFLDDLHWGDASTLLLIRSLLEARDGKALLIVGALRDEALGADHPLAPALADLLQASPVTHLSLAPFDEATTNQLVADGLRTDPERTRALGSLIHRRTDGNPFFARELLRTLYQDGVVGFDQETGRWRWDPEEVQQAGLSENVVGFMLERMKRLDPGTQTLLSRAACIGSTFDLRLLCAAMDEPPSRILTALWPALNAGLIASLDEQALLRAAAGQDDDVTRAIACKFSHDRVRQAAYALVPEVERHRVHLQLGRTLLAEAGDPERAGRVPDILQHLNAARALVSGQRERLALARLNVVAARKAKEAAAYRSAFNFARIAREVLPASARTAHADLACEILELSATCGHLCGEFALAERSCAELLEQSRSPFERAKVRAMTAGLYAYSNRMDEAIQEGIRALDLLGIKLRPRPGVAAVLLELARTKAAQIGRSPQALDDAPEVGDRTIKLAMKILGDFLAPAYLSGNDTLFATTVLKQTRLAMRHGHCVEAITAYSGYAALLAGLGDFSGAEAFGRLAVRLTERFDAGEVKSRVHVLFGLFSHSWSQPWDNLDTWFKTSVEAGLLSGDFLFMAFACGYVHHWSPRVDLATALAQGQRYLQLARQTHYQNAIDAATCATQFWLSLRGETKAFLSLGDDAFDEVACLERMTATGYSSGIAIYHLYKLQLACIHEDWEAAWRELGLAERRMKALAGSPYMVDYGVYGFQAAARIASSGGSRSSEAWRRIRRFKRMMSAWARHCPSNFALHALLMEAELARLSRTPARAADLYERAARAAKESGFFRYEALANEAAARFYLDRGLETAGRAYLLDARESYRRWGALARVETLDRRLPSPAREEGAAGPVAHADSPDFTLGLVPQLVARGVLDLATIWKATQAISGEVILVRLLEKLLAIVKENAGAQHAILLLKQEEEEGSGFLVQAESRDDGTLTLLQAEALEGHPRLPASLVRYVIRSRTSVVLNDAGRLGAFTRDPVIQARRPRSVLAIPIVNQQDLVGVLYLENNLLSDAFTRDHLATMQILAGQAAVSLQNALSAERTAYLEGERTIRDVYERELEARVAERTACLQEAYEQLKALDQMKTNFLGLVSHELRTPLTSIQGYAEFLEDGISGELSGAQHEYVKQIKHGTLGLARLVDDLLDFARMEAGSFKLVPEPFDLAENIAETLESLSPVVQEKGLSVEMRLPDAAAPITADPGRIAQVLLNLLGNAIKFTPAGGRITLSLRAMDAEWRVEVRDTGIGIAHDHLSKLFQRFYQVDSSSTRRHGGTGLGLSIAKSIIEAHGGRIGVGSSPGEGSTFWFTLPVCAQSPQ